MPYVTAPYKVALWIAEKPHERMARYIDESDLIGAVICAQQWMSWSNERGRGKRPKYNRFRVYVNNMDGTWTIGREGEYSRAEMEQPQKGKTTSSKRAIQYPDITHSKGNWAGQEPRRTAGHAPTSRLASLVRKVKGTK